MSELGPGIEATKVKLDIPVGVENGPGTPWEKTVEVIGHDSGFEKPLSIFQRLFADIQKPCKDPTRPLVEHYKGKPWRHIEERTMQ